MKNMKVSLKLIVSFLVVIALAIVVGAIGIVGMYRINAADDALYNTNYLPTVQAGDIAQNLVEQRVYMRNLVIYDVNQDADLFRSAENNLTTTQATMKQLLSDYEKTIVNPKDREAYNKFVTEYNNGWLPITSSIQTLGTNNNTAEAKTTLISSSQIAGTLDALTTELQKVNLDDGAAAVSGNTTLFITMAIIEVVVLVIAIAIAMFFAFYVSGLISKPLGALTGFMNKASSTGDIMFSKQDAEEIKRFSEARDEVGQCIGSTEAFIRRLHDIGDALQSVADGDLTAELSLLSQKDTMGLSLNKMMDNLNHMFSEINSATEQVATGAKQVADGSQALAQGSTEQAASVEELSGSIAEIAQKTKENADMAGRADELANTIKSNAEKGSRQMNEMMSAVKEINEASQSINKVIKVIDDIAFQTNILALNAAVEAARAGQHGKGFAVVAEEVRNLAAKSAEAAKDTGSLIANSMEKAELGARIADETAASLVEIVTGINESTQLVGEIASSSDKQSLGISEINKGIDQVAQVIQQNSATAEESAAASEEMSGQSDMLQGLVAQFKLKGNNNSSIRRTPAMSAPATVQKQTASMNTTYAFAAEIGDSGKY